MADHQAIGGQSNKAGNRYEDFFATHRMMIHTPRFLLENEGMRLKEQASCPVDDIVLDLGARWEYYQLKADRTITWNRDNKRLTSQFLDQKGQCIEKNQDFGLFVVVADDDREVHLTENLPESLQKITTVVKFPRLRRPSEMARLEGPLEIPFQEQAAARMLSSSDREEFVEAFHSARLNSAQDAEGFIVLAQLVDKIRSQDWVKIYTPWDEALEGWSQAKATLQEISGFRFWVDRGYFEWEYPPTDRGLSVSCCGQSFQRFVARVLNQGPATFDELEELLP